MLAPFFSFVTIIIHRLSRDLAAEDMGGDEDVDEPKQQVRIYPSFARPDT